MKRSGGKKSTRKKSAAPAGASLEFSPRLAFWAVPMLAVAAGVLAGGATPSGPLPAGWVAVYVPLFLALDLLLRRHAGRGGLRCWALWGKALACAMTLGALQAAFNGAWVVNTVHVFGGLSLPVSHVINIFGYGAIFGLEAFGFIALPFLLAWRWPRWGFLFVIFFTVVLQSYIPRFFAWTFGQFLHSKPALIQIIDLVGTEGLNIWVLALHLVLFGWLREIYAPGAMGGVGGTGGRRVLVYASLGVAALYIGSHVYGVWRMDDVARATAKGETVNLVGVQPSFTLRNIASDPDLTYSKRDKSLSALMADTAQALARLEPDASAPTLVVWPESVYPAAYFRSDRARRALESWVRIRGLHLILTSLTAANATDDGKRWRGVYGSALHVSPDGGAPDVYNKITLIPFGETIPFSKTFPALGRALKAWIPRISQFEQGEEFTVFPITPTLRLAPLICFDIIGDSVARGMVRNGANFGLVLANLSWFGRTNVSEMFEFFVRFRAIEARIPFLMLSQNGRSLLFDAAGRPASRALGQYEADALTLQAKVPKISSFFVTYQRRIQGAYLLILIALIGWRVLRLRS